MAQDSAFATGVPPDLYTFHRYTRNSLSLYHSRAPAVSIVLTQFSRVLSRPTYRAAYTRFTPSNSG